MQKSICDDLKLTTPFNFSMLCLFGSLPLLSCYAHSINNDQGLRDI